MDSCSFGHTAGGVRFRRTNVQWSTASAVRLHQFARRSGGVPPKLQPLGHGSLSVRTDLWVRSGLLWWGRMQVASRSDLLPRFRMLKRDSSDLEHLTELGPPADGWIGGQ